MRGLRRLIAVVGFAAVAALSISGAPVEVQAAEGAGKIMVAYIGPLTGPAAPWGLGTTRGGKHFLDEANAKGGVRVGGRTMTFDFVTYDHGLDPAKAVELAKRAISGDKASLLVLQTGLCVAPVLPIATENKIANFHITAGSKFMSPSFAYSTRMCVASTWGEAAALKYAKDNLKYRNVITVLADDDAGRDAFTEIKDAAEMADVKILGSEYYVRGTKDFYPILSRVLAKKPDMISYGSSSPGDCYLIMKQAYELGFKGLVTGSAPLDVAQMKKMVPEKTLNNVLLVCPGTPDVAEYTTPEEKEFKRVMIERYGKDGKLFDTTMENFWSECAWASIYLQAIQKADSTDAAKITRAIEGGRFPVLGRTYRFVGKKQYGFDRQILVDVPVMRVVDGVPKVVGVYKSSDAR